MFESLLIGSRLGAHYLWKVYEAASVQVAHSPATTVLHCEGRQWRFLGYDEAHLEFSLQCYIRLKPVGVMSVTFQDGDVYEWNQVTLWAKPNSEAEYALLFC